MLAPRQMPERFMAWNQRYGAPFGRPLRRLRKFRGCIPISIWDRLRGPFALQVNNDTRTFEYPWAYHAAAPDRGMRVVEIGGGLAGLQFVLDRAGCTVVNVDPGMEASGVGWPCDQESMGRLNARFGTHVDLRNTVARQAGLDSSAYDRVFAISVLEHLPEEDIRDAMGEAFRWLKPDGLMLLTVDLFLNSEFQRARARELQEQLPSVKVRAAFCGARPPSLPRRAARRGMRVAGSLLRPLSRHAAVSSAEPLPAYPFAPLPAPSINLVREELDRGPDLCQAEFAEMLPLGAWFPKELPKLSIHHQVHFVYSGRFLQSYGRTSYGSYLDAVMRTQEVAFLRCFDRVIVFGEPDRRALAPYLESSRLGVSPFPIPADVGMASAIPNEFDGRFLFVGSEEHGPNRDALDWLLAEIWSEIVRQLPRARLTVIGRWNAAARASYARHRVCFTGFVEDLSRVLRGGIMLVPLKVGSGIRAKILVALAQGVPVVTTPIGVEGLALAEGCGCLVRSQATEFAAAAVQLARQQELRNRVASAGLQAVASGYSPESVRRQRNGIYEAVVEDFRTRRI